MSFNSSGLLRFFISGDPVSKKTPKIIARAGQQMQMACPISGYPIFNIIWEKGKNRIKYRLKIIRLYHIIISIYSDPEKIKAAAFVII